MAEQNQQLLSVENQIRSSILQIRRCTTQKDRDLLVQQCQDLFGKAKSLYGKLRKTLQREGFGDDHPWKDQHKQELHTLKGNLEQAIAQSERTESENQAQRMKRGSSTVSVHHVKGGGRRALLDLNDRQDTEETIDETEKERLEKELFAPVYRTQQECLVILDRINKKADETLDIGRETGEKLLEQKERLLAVDRQLDEMGSTTKRAKREITSLTRRLMRDKIIVILFALMVFLAIVAVVLGLSYRFVIEPILRGYLADQKKKREQTTEILVLMTEVLGALFRRAFG